MSQFLSGVGVIFSLEMRQRLRECRLVRAPRVSSSAFCFSSPIRHEHRRFQCLATFRENHNVGGLLYSLVIYFVLLLGVLVAPAMSGNAINGDRDSGTLATTQVTLITTWQLVSR